MHVAHAASGTPSSTILVESVPHSSLAASLLDRVFSSWPWYLTRASGLVAGFLLVILLVSGTGFITGTTFRFLEPITAWATHRALGIALGIAIIVHVGALYFDHFVEFNLTALFVPFASRHAPVELFGMSFGSLWVALGIFALYVCIAIILTSLFWIRRKPKTWKLVHLLSYLVMVLVFVHALYLGTDLTHGVLRYVWIGAGVLVVGAALARLWRAYTV